MLTSHYPSFRIFAATVLKLIYGVDIKDLNHEYVLLSQKAMEGLSLGHIPGAHWVEFFPSLSWIPSWVPGSKFKKLAEKYRPAVDDMIRKPFERVQNELVSILHVSSGENLIACLCSWKAQPHRQSSALSSQNLVMMTT